jgi:sarcosine oxidase subunit gamma
VADRIENRSIVSLKISRSSLDPARERLQLAGSLQASGSDPQSLWLGPDRWLLVSDTMAPDVIVDSCKQALVGITHNAVDYSAGLAVFRLTGPEARQLLATGTGVDLRPTKFPTNSCCRTKLAQVAVVIVATAPQVLEVYVDRSLETYLADWIAESSSIYFSYLGDP